MEICRNTIYLLKKESFYVKFMEKGRAQCKRIILLKNAIARPVRDFKFDLKDGPKGLKELSKLSSRLAVCKNSSNSFGSK